ncbi:glycogen synthase [Hydrogenimonas sp.]
MKLLFAAAEIFPFAKSGGLADMAHALPSALGKRVDTTAVMPLYGFVEKEKFAIRPTGERFAFEMGEKTYEIEIFRTFYEGVEHLFVYNERLCERDFLYGPPGGCYEDNDIRFAIFSHTLVELSKRLSVDLLHLNDWHTALAAPLARDAGSSVKILYTIHNLAYQGLFPAESIASIGLAAYHFTMEDMEFYGRLNWMKGGILHSDLVTTVSPSYAVEIQKPEFGCGLDGFLRRHRKKLRGVLNGIDTTLYDPAGDPALPLRYDAKDPTNKKACKHLFLDEIGATRSEWPLFVFIGRFVEQKGVDWIVEAVDVLGRMALNLAILGEGDPKYHVALEAAAERYDNLHVRFGYDESLSHRMYAAADFLLMPSRFEPCGLNQMIAMRYGTIPVVHRVGGLRDTVHSWRGRGRICGKGIFFETPEASAMVTAVEEALRLYGDTKRFESVGRFDMECDFSIEKCAERYLKLYRELP